MAGNTIGGIPATIVFTLIISFFAFFASITCVTLYYYKRDPRRLERLRRLEQAFEASETIPLGVSEEAPILWEVWADRHPKPTSKWEDLLVCFLLSSLPPFSFNSKLPNFHPQPLNLTYDSDQDRSAARASSSLHHPQPPRPSHRDMTSYNLSVFIAMPSPHEQIPSEFGGEFAIGTAQFLYPHRPEHLHLQ